MKTCLFIILILLLSKPMFSQINDNEVKEKEVAYWSGRSTILAQDVTKEQLWKTLTNIMEWNKWDDGIEWTKIDGKPKSGKTFYLKPQGVPEIELTITTFDEPYVFEDFFQVNSADIYTTHTIADKGENLEIPIEIRILGEKAHEWVEFGEMQIKGMPDQTEKLIQMTRETYEKR